MTTPRTDAAAFYAGDVGDEVVKAAVCREIENDLFISQIRAEDWRKTVADRERDLAAAQEARRSAEALAAQNEADAERYRYLHGRADACALADFSFNKGDAISGEWIIVKQDVDAGDAMDAAIDAARSQP